MSRNTLNQPPLALALVWEDLSAAFEQLTHWLSEVSPEHYRLQDLSGDAEPPHGQTPGRHLRHIIDHFDALSGGLRAASGKPADTPTVDYELRTRDPRIETDPAAALARIEQQQRLFAEYCEAGDRVLSVIHRTDHGETILHSSLSRELIFLSQHSVHHMAIIELLMLWQGEAISGDFGVNPSTRRYQASPGESGPGQQRRKVGVS